MRSRKWPHITIRESDRTDSSRIPPTIRTASLKSARVLSVGVPRALDELHKRPAGSRRLGRSRLNTTAEKRRLQARGLDEEIFFAIASERP